MAIATLMTNWTMGLAPPERSDRYDFDLIAAPALLLHRDVKTIRRPLEETSG